MGKQQRYEVHFFIDSPSDDAAHKAANAAWAAFEANNVSLFEATAHRAVDGHPMDTGWSGWGEEPIHQTAVRRGIPTSTGDATSRDVT